MMAFVVKHAKPILDNISYFESNCTRMLHVYGNLEDIQICYSIQPDGEMVEEFFQGLHVDAEVKSDLIENFKLAFIYTTDKLTRYTMDGGNQPGIGVIKATRVFNPLKVNLLAHTQTRDLYNDSIPGFSEVSYKEFQMYLRKADHATSNLSNENDNKGIIISFWASNKCSLPRPYHLYRVYSRLGSNTADVERSFSQLKILFSAQRQRLTGESLKQLASLNWYLNAKHSDGAADVIEKLVGIVMRKCLLILN